MSDANIGDFSTNPADNITVMSVDIGGCMKVEQIDDAFRRVLAVVAGADFGGKTVKADTIIESTLDAGVTIEGVLLKDGMITGLNNQNSEAIFRTGDFREIMRNSADPGWLLANGDTIGSAGSSATQASADNEALFLFIWNNYDDTRNPVVGGRGASAEADWAANKAITLPNRNGRVGVGAGAAAGLTAREAGDTGGAETVALTAAQNGPHDHSITKGRKFGSDQGGSAGWGNDLGNAGNQTFTTTSSGTGEAHENMPPFYVPVYQIKL